MQHKVQCAMFSTYWGDSSACYGGRSDCFGPENSTSSQDALKTHVSIPSCLSKLSVVNIMIHRTALICSRQLRETSAKDIEQREGSWKVLTFQTPPVVPMVALGWHFCRFLWLRCSLDDDPMSAHTVLHEFVFNRVVVAI